MLLLIIEIYKQFTNFTVNFVFNSCLVTNLQNAVRHHLKSVWTKSKKKFYVIFCR